MKRQFRHTPRGIRHMLLGRNPPVRCFSIQGNIEQRHGFLPRLTTVEKAVACCEGG